MNVSLEHLMTHLPCKPGCVYCTRAKATRKPARRVDPDVCEQEMHDHDVKYFGDWLWYDHLAILKSNHLGTNGEKTGAYAVDRATYMRNLYPTTQRNSQQTQAALRHFSGACSPTVAYSDCSKEI